MSAEPFQHGRKHLRAFVADDVAAFKCARHVANLVFSVVNSIGAQVVNFSLAPRRSPRFRCLPTHPPPSPNPFRPPPPLSPPHKIDNPGISHPHRHTPNFHSPTPPPHQFHICAIQFPQDPPRTHTSFSPYFPTIPSLSPYLRYGLVSIKFPMMFAVAFHYPAPQVSFGKVGSSERSRATSSTKLMAEHR